MTRSTGSYKVQFGYRVETSGLAEPRAYLTEIEGQF